LTLARVFEDIGVCAHAGAAGLPFLANSAYIGSERPRAFSLPKRNMSETSVFKLRA
jgi:hypothetical protein